MCINSYNLVAWIYSNLHLNCEQKSKGEAIRENWIESEISEGVYSILTLLWDLWHVNSKWIWNMNVRLLYFQLSNTLWCPRYCCACKIMAIRSEFNMFVVNNTQFTGLWWCHNMETLRSLLAIYDGNPPVTVGPLTKCQLYGALRSFVFVLSRNKLLKLNNIGALHIGGRQC